ncbi:Major facilitator superfamily MFS_1 [metagenome]|uniref:Major facilitator superfamily MFS_1 n=1 Tax=metagenome TaxID=256318 RepID=A0A2P2C9J8_9ZZZZ
MAQAYVRDRLTWVAYVMLAWFAYLQAAPGLVVPHLRDELDLSYTAGGLHVAAFAVGSILAGLTSSRLERRIGRRLVLWSSSAVLAVGTVGLTAGDRVEATVAALLVMGLGGGMLLATIQATLADHHGVRRTVALAEANVAAGVSYLVLIGVFAATAALGAGWRTALLVSLLVPAVIWVLNRGLPVVEGPPSHLQGSSLPGVFWVAAVVLMCGAAAEWCVTAWGATFVEEAAEVSTDTAVSLMAGYFGGFLVGRTVGSRLAHRHEPTRLLGVALAIALVGFAVLWPSTTIAQALVGLSLLGVGIGNLFPMALSMTVALAPDRAALASGRAVSVTSLAVLLAPLTVGSLADATSLKAALLIVPLMLVLAGAGLLLVSRGRPPGTGGRATAESSLDRPRSRVRTFRPARSPRRGSAAGR